MRKQGGKVNNYLGNDGKSWVFKEVEFQHIKDQLQKISEAIIEKGMLYQVKGIGPSGIGQKMVIIMLRMR